MTGGIGVEAVAEHAAALRRALGLRLVGQDAVIDEVLAAWLSGGHVLLEGVPGLGKTLLARSLADAFGVAFRRIQFTPDLMPADVVGTRIFDLARSVFVTQRGPVFTEILLADEINRTPPKTQAALLEAMEERQVTLDGETLPLPEGFFVVATQNPLDHEGTYPLPEAQLDRFAMKVRVGYPSPEDELEVYRRFVSGATATVPRVSEPSVLGGLRQVVARVHVEEKVLQYALAVLRATRSSRRLIAGASPRAGQLWIGAARATAAMAGRAFVLPDDLKRVAPAVLRHRLRPTADAELDGVDGDTVVTEVLAGVPVPR
jgi:MoxR-like ATPase